MKPSAIQALIEAAEAMVALDQAEKIIGDDEVLDVLGDLAGAVSEAKGEVKEAGRIIRALLGVPTPKTWEKWPNIYNKATEFLATLETGQELRPGTQIIYVPTHAEGDPDHPDCEAGFVTSVKEDKEIAFCRYWRKNPPYDLRTVANSEATPLSLIIVKDTVPQMRVDTALRQIQKGQE